jgi:mannitol/fructose-specific phosphotransferase system IIA component (Ntr-type)
MRIPIAHIEPALESVERFGAIGELVQRLIHAGAIRRLDEESVFAALRSREETMSTGIGYRLGIPHAFTDAVAQPVVAFGRSRAGLEFDALDDALVEFVAVVLLPANSVTKSRATKSRALPFTARICSVLTKRAVQGTSAWLCRCAGDRRSFGGRVR